MTQQAPITIEHPPKAPSMYYEQLRSDYEKRLDRQLNHRRQVSPYWSAEQLNQAQYMSRDESSGSIGVDSSGVNSSFTRKSSMKKQVRFQVYNAKNLTTMQEMREQKMSELDRFSRERVLQQTVLELKQKQQP